MEDPANENIAAGGASQAGEVGLKPIEGQLHAHILQRLRELRAVFRLKFGQSRLDRGVFRLCQQLVQRRAVQGGQKLLDADALFRQQRGERIFPTFVGLEEAHGFFMLQILPLLGVHQLYLPLRAVGAAELALLYCVFRVGLHPLGVKGQGVDQVHQGLLGNLVQNLRDHAVGLLLDPVVDVRQGALVKGGLIGICAVVVRIGLQEALLHSEARVRGEPDGICQLQASVALQGLHVSPETSVPPVPVQAQGLLHLGQSLSLGAVGRHGQGAEHGERREQGVFVRLVSGPEEPQGKVRGGLRSRRVHRGGFRLHGLNLRHQVHGAHGQHRSLTRIGLSGICAGLFSAWTGLPGAGRTAQQHRRAQQQTNESTFLHEIPSFPLMGIEQVAELIRSKTRNPAGPATPGFRSAGVPAGRRPPERPGPSRHNPSRPRPGRSPGSSR